MLLAVIGLLRYPEKFYRSLASFRLNLKLCVSNSIISNECVKYYGNFREEEENNLPQMKKLFFLYVWLNLTRIAELRKEDLVKHIRSH